MKIYKLTYEEIDTEYKYNPEKNKKLTCQEGIYDYELENILNQEEWVKTVKQNIFDKMKDNIL